MAQLRQKLVDLFRPELKAGLDQAAVDTLDFILDRGGVPRDDGSAAKEPVSVGGRGTRDAVAGFFRPLLRHGFSQRLVTRMDEILDLAGLSHDATVPSDSPGGPDENIPVPVPPPSAPAAKALAGPDAIRIVQEFEGCAKKIGGGKLQAYPDPGSGGDPWTIGWGSTGPDIKRGTVWTQEQADARFAEHLQEFAAKVARLVGPARTSQRQFDAMLSLAYNVGVGNLAGSTLLKKHKRGDYAGASNEFIRWNKAAGRVMHGLSRRRQAEAKLYRSG